MSVMVSHRRNCALVCQLTIMMATVFLFGGRRGLGGLNQARRPFWGRSIALKVLGQRMTAQVYAAGNPDPISGRMTTITRQPNGGRGDIVHIRKPAERRLALIGAPHSRPLQQGL